MGKSQRKGGFFLYPENTDGLPVIHKSVCVWGGGGAGLQVNTMTLSCCDLEIRLSKKADLRKEVCSEE